MSIIYPGMKSGASGVQPGTPTALLRSLGTPTTNLFQPIRRNSTTGSNLSLSAVITSGSTLQASTLLALNTTEERVVGDRSGVVYADVGCQTDPLQPAKAEGSERPAVESPDHKAGANRNRGGSDGASAAGLSRDVQRPQASRNVALVHQRSRSNEMDYSSAGITAGKSITTDFQSPPGSYKNMRAFRPVSTGSTGTGSMFFSDSLPSVSTRGQTISRTESSDSTRTLTPSPDVSARGSSGPVARVSSEGRPVSSSFWSREFATMSDYFASDTNIEVTDC